MCFSVVFRFSIHAVVFFGRAVFEAQTCVCVCVCVWVGEGEGGDPETAGGVFCGRVMGSL